jgi:hypothetical protein
VDAIFDHADPDRIATALMQRVQDGDPNVADALLKLLDGVPTDTVMAAQQELSGDENAPATPHEVACSSDPQKARKPEERPRRSRANVCAKTFRLRHTILRMSITRAAATPLELHQSAARHFKQFAVDDPLMVAEVLCPIRAKFWGSSMAKLPCNSHIFKIS